MYVCTLVIMILVSIHMCVHNGCFHERKPKGHVIINHMCVHVGEYVMVQEHVCVYIGHYDIGFNPYDLC